MLQSARHALRLSEVRQRLNEIVNLDGELSEDVRAESDRLTSEFRDVETRWRAAVVAESGEAERRENSEDGEGAELRSLIANASVGRYAAAAADNRPLAGPEADLNQALQVSAEAGGVAVPWRLIAEQRAFTSTSQNDGPTSQAPALPRLFGRGLFGELGVRTVNVPAGMSEWPLITAGAVPAAEPEGDTVADPAAATFAISALKPKRLTSALRFTYEMAASVPMLEDTLRMDISEALQAEMTDALINGSGSGGAVSGLLTSITAPADPSDVATHAEYLSALASAIDGLHASNESEVGIVLGTSTYQMAAKIIVTNTEVSVTDSLRQKARSVSASSFIPAPASNIQNAIVHGGMAGGERSDSIAAVWPAVELIRDPYGSANRGAGVWLTAIMLWDLAAPFRTGAYKRWKFKLA